VRIGALGTARWLALVVVAVSLTACRHDPRPSASTERAALALVLLPDRSNDCCVVVSVNGEGRSIQTLCQVTVFDPDGELSSLGSFPVPLPAGDAARSAVG
jgi:hypothetical protein